MTITGHGEKNNITYSWTFDNTDGLTTRNIATTHVNPNGFYDLIGNVEEWVESGSQNPNAQILGGSVNTVIKNLVHLKIDGNMKIDLVNKKIN